MKKFQLKFVYAIWETFFLFLNVFIFYILFDWKFKKNFWELFYLKKKRNKAKRNSFILHYRWVGDCTPYPSNNSKGIDVHD